jgi:hypothetical protein
MGRKDSEFVMLSLIEWGLWKLNRRLWVELQNMTLQLLKVGNSVRSGFFKLRIRSGHYIGRTPAFPGSRSS